MKIMTNAANVQYLPLPLFYSLSFHGTSYIKSTQLNDSELINLSIYLFCHLNDV